MGFQHHWSQTKIRHYVFWSLDWPTIEILCRWTTNPRSKSGIGKLSPTRTNCYSVLQSSQETLGWAFDIWTCSGFVNFTGCCDITAKLNRGQEKERLHQFRVRLNDNAFEIVYLNILRMELLPSVNLAYSVIICEECHSSIAQGKEEKVEVVAFAARVAKPLLADKSRLFYDVCEKNGHEARSFLFK